MARFVLVLLRHGHAEDGVRGADHARRLTDRGKKQARATAAKLAAPAWRPERALVSDAARTMETLGEVLGALGALPYEARSDLYLGGVGALRSALAEQEGARLLVIGHNPSLSELATRLTRDYVALGTAEAAVLAVEAADWAEAVQLDGVWELVAEVT